MTNQLEKYISLLSVPIREIGLNNMPEGCASACIIDYEGKHILLTVQHATGNMGNWGIQLRFVPGRGTAIQRLGQMNFLKSISIANMESRDIDFAHVEVPENLEIYEQEITEIGEITREEKRPISKIDFNIHPSASESYGFSGQILAKLDEKNLITELAIYTGLKYIGDEGDYFKFKLPFKHPGHDRFEGCSGAPIVDSQGNIVALVCGSPKDLSEDIIYGISLKKYEIALNATYGYLRNALDSQVR
jgi:hypothetical protein